MSSLACSKEYEMPTPLAINTNIPSITAQKSLLRTQRSLQTTVARLSSGKRLNSAADDAAGMAVSTGLNAQLRGYHQAVRNASDGVAILQTAEGAYNAISDTLIRMRELAVQSASDGLTDTERTYVDTEFQALKSEIDRVSNVTEYNGQMLLDGTAGDGSGNMTFQVGTRNTANDRITITLADQDTTALGINGAAVGSLANAQSAITSIDTALDSLSKDRATLGSTINHMTAAIDNLSSTIENVSKAASQIQDADMATESAHLARSQVLQQAGVAMLAQANQSPGLALRLLG